VKEPTVKHRHPSYRDYIHNVYLDLLKSYSGNIGEKTIYGTVITLELIDKVKERYLKLLNSPKGMTKV
tara:strand:+ start:6039 stop:6242 length:204 start_codon:yes stop_codon:yes gene_type:complete